MMMMLLGFMFGKEPRTRPAQARIVVTSMTDSGHMAAHGTGVILSKIAANHGRRPKRTGISGQGGGSRGHAGLVWLFWTMRLERRPRMTAPSKMGHIIVMMMLILGGVLCRHECHGSNDLGLLFGFSATEIGSSCSAFGSQDRLGRSPRRSNDCRMRRSR